MWLDVLVHMMKRSTAADELRRPWNLWMGTGSAANAHNYMLPI
jgi:hypothetical protein